MLNELRLVFRTAGVYTDAEVVRLAYEKTLRLRQLYEEEFKTIEQLMKVKKMQYHQELRQERELYRKFIFPLCCYGSIFPALANIHYMLHPRCLNT